MTDASHQSVRRSSDGMLLVVLFVAAFMARAGYGLLVHQGSSEQGPSALSFEDEQWYWALAENLNSGHGLYGEFGHRAERMPLYPWFLSWFAGPGGGVRLARYAQWVVGGLVAPLTFLLARRLLLNRTSRARYQLTKEDAPDDNSADHEAEPALGRGLRLGTPSRGVVQVVAFLAGLVAAFDPSLVGSASLLLSETLFVTSMAAWWACAAPLRRVGEDRWWDWVGAALLGAITVHLRESSVALVGMLAVLLVLVRRDKRSLVGGAAMILVMVMSLVPWAYRNKQVVGEWVWLTTRGGISLYDAVRPGATGESDLGDIKAAPRVADLPEAEWNRWFAEASRKEIREHPGRVIGLAPRKIARLWSPVVHAYSSRAVRAVFAVWYIPLYTLVLAGVILHRRHWRTILLLLLPAICLTMIHAVYIGSLRYRVGAMPMLGVLAAIGLAALWPRRKRRTE